MISAFSHSWAFLTLHAWMSLFILPASKKNVLISSIACSRHADTKIIEKAILCWSRLIESARDSEKLTRLASGGLMPNLITLLTVKPRPVSPTTFTSIIRTLNNLLSYVNTIWLLVLVLRTTFTFITFCP